MITRELLAKLRLENTSLLARMDQVHAQAERDGNVSLAHDAAMLRDQLRDYLALVDALLDALTPDVPRRKVS